MFPLRDSTKSMTFPLVTVILIAVNLIIYFWEASLPEQRFYELLYSWGLTPANLWHISTLPHWAASIFTAMFMHGSLSHVIGNMWILWLFGDNVEDHMGRRNFITFYLTGGVVAAFVHCLFFPSSQVPVVGASGAVAGVMGAYFLMFKRATILTFIFPFFLIPIPAMFYLGVWIAIQFFSGATSLTAAGNSIAFLAHVGGFAAGMLLHRRFIEYRPNGDLF